jgi:LacI family transcriptional regulator
MIGYQAAQLLMEQILQKKKLITSKRIPVELIIRDSCSQKK